MGQSPPKRTAKVFFSFFFETFYPLFFRLFRKPLIIHCIIKIN